MQFDHMTRETSQGRSCVPGVEPWLLVRCGICRSNSLSNSMVNATRAWESRVGNGVAGGCINGDAADLSREKS